MTGRRGFGMSSAVNHCGRSRAGTRIEFAPSLDQARRQRGYVRLLLGDTKEAIVDLDEAIRLAPLDEVAHHLRALAYEKAEKFAEAEKDLDEAARLRPDSVDVLRDRARFRWCRKNDLAGAERDYTRVIELDPRSAAAYFNRGQVRMAQEKPALASEDYSAAIEIDPRYADAYCRRANAKLALGDTQGAAEDYRKALEVAPPEWPYRDGIRRWLEERGS